MPLDPAPGYRYAYSGTSVGIGNNGYSWSSATSGINGLSLNFHSQYLYLRSTYGRGHGIQLRYLSE